MKHLLADRAAVDSPTAKEQAQWADKLAEMQSLLAAIEDLDNQAFVSMPDAAALRAKYLRRVANDVPQAIKVLRGAFDANPDSYYLADLMAQAQLEIGDRTEALKTYRKALDYVERFDEKNIWSCATAATAAIALRDSDAARKWMAVMFAIGPPNQSELDAVGRGLREVGVRLGMPESDIDTLLAMAEARGERKPS